MLFITSMLSVFYTMLLGYALYYMVLGFASELPWAHCQHDFNTPCKQLCNVLIFKA